VVHISAVMLRPGLCSVSQAKGCFPWLDPPHKSSRRQEHRQLSWHKASLEKLDRNREVCRAAIAMRPTANYYIKTWEVLRWPLQILDG